MTAAIAAAAAGTALGALVQSAGGFGFALVASPALFATLEPAEAVGAVLIIGSGLNAVVLGLERRRGTVRWRDLRPMLVAAAPGLAVGVLALEALAKEALQAVVGVAVLAALLVRRRRPHPAGRASSIPVGLAVGTLTTSTSVNGPLLVLWLRARGAAPAELRSSLAASFLALNVLGAAVLAVTIGAGRAPEPGLLLALAPAALAGHVVGRRLFTRMPAHRFEALGTTVVIVAGLASLAAAAL